MVDKEAAGSYETDRFMLIKMRGFAIPLICERQFERRTFLWKTFAPKPKKLSYKTVRRWKSIILFVRYIISNVKF